MSHAVQAIFTGKNQWTQ